MDLAPQEVWSDCLNARGAKLRSTPFGLARTDPTRSSSAGQTHVAVPDQFSADWNESKHAALLTSLAPVALGQPCQVEFVVDSRTRQRVQMDLFVAPAAAASTASNGAFAAPRPLLNAKYTLDNFVIGKSNELAASAALAVAEAPAATSTRCSSMGDGTARRTSCRR